MVMIAKLYYTSCRTYWKWLTHPITENGYTHFRRLDILSDHQLQDAVRMAYPPHHWKWIRYHFDIISHHHYVITSKPLKWVRPFSVMGWVSHSQCVLQLMMTYYVETSGMGVSILSDGVGKPFSVRPAVYDELLCRDVWSSDGVGKPLSVFPPADADFLCRNV